MVVPHQARVAFFLAAQALILAGMFSPYPIRRKKNR
jgi:hypothetical protein